MIVLNISLTLYSILLLSIDILYLHENCLCILMQFSNILFIYVYHCPISTKKNVINVLETTPLSNNKGNINSVLSVIFYFLFLPEF